METHDQIETCTGADHERFKAESEAVAERSASRPAGQAVCGIAAAAWNNETFPLTGFNHQVWPADEANDDYADAVVRWSAEGHDYELTLRLNVIHGWTYVDLEVDGEDVADLRGQATVGEEPMKIAVTGGSEFEIGPWEDHIVAVAAQLRALAGQ